MDPEPDTPTAPGFSISSVIVNGKTIASHRALQQDAYRRAPAGPSNNVGLRSAGALEPVRFLVDGRCVGAERRQVQEAAGQREVLQDGAGIAPMADEGRDDAESRQKPRRDPGLETCLLYTSPSPRD